jgi:septal ring factor EnvC (AmiA/AmiB activator)
MFLKKSNITLLALTLALNAFAEESVIPISRGEIAPFDGYLINQERAERFRTLGIELQFVNKNLQLVSEQNVLLNDQLNLASKQIGDLNKQLTDVKDTSLLSKIGMFVLGAGTATLMAFAVSRSIQ